MREKQEVHGKQHCHTEMETLYQSSSQVIKPQTISHPEEQESNVKRFSNMSKCILEERLKKRRKL